MAVAQKVKWDEEKKQEAIAAWKASNQGASVWCDGMKFTLRDGTIVHKPAYATFKKWDGVVTKPKAATKSASATTLMAEFEEALAKQEETKEQKFLKFLKAKRTELEAALADVEAEIAKLEPEPASTLETVGD
ncbi:hypothetical protein [Pseudomonas sp. 2FE]|uniref:hypothetical protein n=1 Tax=Pseudomonas sp. 2FE TaxID=2502190 RepID=UPI0010F89C0C|nr:hypothetical protein [Pseudomonas sp. 2FE]